VPMIEVAAAVAANADIFVVIGTSLVVYPAAGLLHYAPRNCPKFIVDRSVPSTAGVSNLTAIEKPATEGIVLLQQQLRNLI